MQDRHLCWLPPYFFLGPAVAPTFFILESPLEGGRFSSKVPVRGRFYKKRFKTTDLTCAINCCVLFETFGLILTNPSLKVLGANLLIEVKNMCI